MLSLPWDSELPDAWPEHVDGQQQGNEGHPDGLTHGHVDQPSHQHLDHFDQNSVKFLSSISSIPAWKHSNLSDLFSANPIESFVQNIKHITVATPSRPRPSVLPEASQILFASNQHSTIHQQSISQTSMNTSSRNFSTSSSVIIQNHLPAYDPFGTPQNQQRKMSDASEYTASLPDDLPHDAGKSIDQTPRPNRTPAHLEQEEMKPPAKENFSFAFEEDKLRELNEMLPVREPENFQPLFHLGDNPLEDLDADLDELDESAFQLQPEPKRMKLESHAEVDFADFEDDELLTSRLASLNIAKGAVELPIGADQANISFDDAPADPSPIKSMNTTTHKTEYPEDIDFLDDVSDGRQLQTDPVISLANTEKESTLSSKNTHSSKSSNQLSEYSSDTSKHGSKKSRMVTIRNLNASSALMSLIADTHNMSFNNEKKCWEGPEELLSQFGSQRIDEPTQQSVQIDATSFRHEFRPTEEQVSLDDNDLAELDAENDEDIKGLTGMESAFQSLANIEVTKADFDHSFLPPPVPKDENMPPFPRKVQHPEMSIIASSRRSAALSSRYSGSFHPFCSDFNS